MIRIALGYPLRRLCQRDLAGGGTVSKSSNKRQQNSDEGESGEIKDIKALSLLLTTGGRMGF